MLASKIDTPASGKNCIGSCILACRSGKRQFHRPLAVAALGGCARVVHVRQKSKIVANSKLRPEGSKQ